MHQAFLRSRFALLAAALAVCCLTAASAQAQGRRRARPAAPPSASPANVAERSAARVPSPRELLGFTPGDDRRVADWNQIREYFTRLDRASDRVVVRRLGETTQGRPLFVAFISSPENIRELDRYREIQRRLADPRLVSGAAERDRLVREGRTVVVISCSIHSTEIVASQMSMQLAYELASAQDAATREILDNTILLLIPSPNPDGIDIVADWYRRSLGKPWEGSEPPELYHHYAGHDDNRDWFMLNLKETRAVTRLLWKEWFPQVVYDVHQQGSTGSRFFVPPFYDPPNPHIAPLLLREVGLVGHKIAADLEAAGFKGVVTNAMYDTWWHGGFRTAPYYHNAVGILTEAASARLMTPVKVTPEQLRRSSVRGMPSALPDGPTTNFPDPWPGGEWRPRDIMGLELTASRAVLSLAAKYRERYLRNFYDLGVRALDWPRAGDAGDAGDVLAYLIPAGQGKDESVAKLVTLLIEQGVEVHRMDAELHLTLATPSTTGRGTVYNDARQPPHEWPSGSYLVFLRQPYRANVQALFERQIYPDRLAGGAPERPYDVAGWTLPMQMGVEAYPVRTIREPEGQRRLMLVRDEFGVRRDLGLDTGVPFRPGTVINDRPAVDVTLLDPPIQNPIKRPVRLALYRSWTGSMDEGWTRWLFDTFNVPYTSLRDAEVRGGSLRAKYDVIVLPSMRPREIVEGRARETAPAEFTGGITETGVAALRRFVEEGGTLVCWDDSTELAIKSFDLPVRNVLEGVRPAEFYCPGSVVRVEVETAHPLARGFGRQADAYFVNSAAFEVTDPQRARVVARYAARKEDVLRSGWLLGAEKLAGRAALVEATLGRGRVVLFGFRPQHRGQTWGTFPFIFNAIELNAER
jgi:hypothetical protein